MKSDRDEAKKTTSQHMGWKLSSRITEKHLGVSVDSKCHLSSRCDHCQESSLALLEKGRQHLVLCSAGDNTLEEGQLQTGKHPKGSYLGELETKL